MQQLKRIGVFCEKIRNGGKTMKTKFVLNALFTTTCLTILGIFFSEYAYGKERTERDSLPSVFVLNDSFITTISSNLSSMQVALSAENEVLILNIHKQKPAVFIREQRESELMIEQWMTKPLSSNLLSSSTETEPELQVEPWMCSANYLSNLLVPEPELQIEKWMLNNISH
jgi:hypothetical protein